METIDRKTLVYRIDLKRKWTNNDLEKPIILEKILTQFFTKNLNKNGTGKEKFQVPKQYKKYWISAYNYTDNIIKVVINYSIYNQYKDIIDVDTGKKTKQKERNEGDKERQHILIKLYPKTNKAILIFEYIHMGIYVNLLRDEIREFITNNINDHEKIQLSIEPLPNKDFVKELMTMNKISAIKLIVDSEECTFDDDIMFSENNISRKEVEILYKPVTKLSFGANKVKGFYENYAGNSDKKKKIKRIIIDGSKSNGRIRLDTDRMKLSSYIKTELDSTGQVDSKEILDRYEILVKREFENYIDNVILTNFEGGDEDVEES